MLITLEPGNISFYFKSMPAPVEFRSLPVADRLQLVEAIWDSIVEDQSSLPDHPSVIQEVRERKAHYLANPGSGTTWEVAKKEIRSGRD